MEQIRKALLTLAGLFFVLLGIVGVFMPVMPSIPFFIIASVCFSKSSRRFHDMLMENPLVGPHIRRYHENSGITFRMKFLLLACQWGGLIFTSMFFVRGLWGRALMLGIGLAATFYILSLKTAEE